MFTSFPLMVVTATSSSKAPHAKRTVKVAQKSALSQNVFEFKLEYAPATLALDLPVCKHVCVFAKDDQDKEFSRKYTPTRHGPGWFQLIVKIDKTGKMGKALDLVRVGDTMQVAGPVGLEEYLGHGRFKVANQRQFTHLLLIAGGTGLTPFLQLVRTILRNSEKDSTNIHLLSCNSTLQDVFLRKELENLQHCFPERFHVWFTISQPPSSSWPYSVGRISHELIQNQYANLPQATTLVSICGPPAFLDAAQSAISGFAHVVLPEGQQALTWHKGITRFVTKHPHPRRANGGGCLLTTHEFLIYFPSQSITL
ncbi:hypothetical protein BASA81_001361 [Batrachochytrium salamandrivorans]|nr:hypothetical protein BASA81_001361 [Batrachochytrium salamandrivorans]